MNNLIKYIQLELEKINFHGNILVAQDENILFQKSVGPANVQENIPLTNVSIFKICSVTKQFTASLILKLVQENRLNLEDPIHLHLPNYTRHKINASWSHTVQIHHLLCHTSGIPDYINLPLFQKYLYTPHSLAKILSFINNESLSFKPGTTFAYSNSNYILLGEMIRYVSKKNFSEFLKKNICIPLGLKHTEPITYTSKNRILSLNSAGERHIVGHLRSTKTPHIFKIKDEKFLVSNLAYETSADGNLISCVDDLHKWNLSLFHNKLLSGSFTSKLLAPHIKMNLPSFLEISPHIEAYYCYGIIKVINTSTGNSFYRHGGYEPGFRTELSYNPVTGISVIILSNSSWEDQREDPLKDIRILSENIHNQTS